MLMAADVVVLKHETSTFRQSHNFISIDFKFGVGDYVREVTNHRRRNWGGAKGAQAPNRQVGGTYRSGPPKFAVKIYWQKCYFACNSSEIKHYYP